MRGVGAVSDLITSLLECLGLLALALAAGVYLWRFDPALGLAGGGVTLIVVSALVTFQQREPAP